MLVVQKCETKSSSSLHLLQHQRIEIMPTKASVHFSSGCSAGWSQTDEARPLENCQCFWLQRFGIEGCEALLPGLSALAASSAAAGVRRIEVHNLDLYVSIA